jgi:TIR domain
MPISDRELEHIRRKQREFLDALLVKRWTTPRLSLGERDALEAGRQVGLPPILVSEFLHYWVSSGDLEQSWIPVARNIQASLGDDPFREEDSAAAQDETTRPLVFLCHASEDKPTVRSYHSRLIDAGFDAWLDEDKILPGQDWDLEIGRALKKSSSVIVFLSRHSQKRGYLQKEILRALDEAEQQPEGAIFLIPAKMEPCEVPDRLSRLHWVDLQAEQGFERLCRSLETRRSPVP